MRTLIMCSAMIMVLLLPARAQDIESKLSGSTSAQGFTIFNSVASPLMTVRGNGRVGIGVLNPDALLHVSGQVKITGGSPGAGKVLTSDATGLATWVAPAAGDITTVGSMTSGAAFAGPTADGEWLGLGSAAGRIQFEDMATDAVNVLNARVGIGTSTPAATLHVNGDVAITGGTPGTGKVLTSDVVGHASWQTAQQNSLDEAYDEGGAGAGRTITADAGAVTIAGRDGLLVSGTHGSGSVMASGTGPRMFFYPKKSALRVGYVDGTEWDDANIGQYSIAIGRNAKASGNTSMAIGNAVEAINIGSVIIGDSYTTSVRTNALYRSFVAYFENGYSLHTHSTNNIGVRVGANGTSWSSISDSTRKDAFLSVDAESVLRKFRTLRIGSWHLTGTPARDRHYGPMAQEWFSAFGRDGIGVIGDDTTLASADVDGILCLAVHALEQRTAQLTIAERRIATLEQDLAALRRDVERLLTVHAAAQSQTLAPTK